MDAIFGEGQHVVVSRFLSLPPTLPLPFPSRVPAVHSLAAVLAPTVLASRTPCCGAPAPEAHVLPEKCLERLAF